MTSNDDELPPHLRKPSEHVRKMAKVTEEDGMERTSTGLIGNKPLLTVFFCKQNGEVQGFSYAHLYRLSSPSQDVIEAEFSDHVVTITGQKLAHVLRHLGDHKRYRVWESTAREVEFSADGAEVVESIAIRERKPE